MSRRRSVLGSRSNFNSRRGMASPRGFLWFPAARCPILSRGTSFKWPKNTSTWRLRGPTKRKPKSTSVGIFRREARTHGGGTKSAMIRAHRRIARSTRVTAGMCAPAGLDVPGKTNKLLHHISTIDRSNLRFVVGRAPSFWIAMLTFFSLTFFLSFSFTPIASV